MELYRKIETNKKLLKNTETYRNILKYKVILKSLNEYKGSPVEDEPLSSCNIVDMSKLVRAYIYIYIYIYKYTYRHMNEN